MGIKAMCENRRCGWRGLVSELLKAPHPFEMGEVIHGCPRCNDIDSVVGACEAEGCWKKATCGTPTDSGYKHTCSKHQPGRSG